MTTQSVERLDRTDIVEDAPIEQIITEEFIKRFEQQAELYQNRYLPICLKLTNEADWVNHGRADKPKYSIQAPGAEKICNPLGIVWDRPVVVKHERQDERGGFYEYEVEGIIQCRVLRRYGWFTGNCSSRDQFFNARGHFDEGDIKKAAFSNWIVNGVSRLAGIRNPTFDILKKAGLDPAKIEGVDYSGRRSPEQDATSISEAQRKRLWAICKSHNVSEEAVKKQFGLTSFNDVKRGDYDRICKWAEDGGKVESPAAPTGQGKDGNAEVSPPVETKTAPTPAGDISPAAGEPIPTERLIIRISEHVESGKVTRAALTSYCHKNFCDKAHKEPVCDDVKKLNLLQLQAVSAWLTLQ